ncbi:MAG: hypothetical protein ACLTOV_10800 [Phocaeicola sp.]
MGILIEEYPYEAAVVKDILHGIDALENVEGRVSIHYVGYYYNTHLKDCVFILPKVLLKDGKEGKGTGLWQIYSRSHRQPRCRQSAEQRRAQLSV